MMIINGIDFDKRLDRAKEVSHHFIDTLGSIQKIMSSEPMFGAPLDYVAKAIGVAVAMEDFKSKIMWPSTALNFPIGGTVHRGEFITLKK